MLAARLSVHPFELAPWHADAACRGIGWWPFYLDRDEGGDFSTATRLCDVCLVNVECATAGWRDPYGLWGGLTARERRSARQVQQTPARAVGAARARRKLAS